MTRSYTVRFDAASAGFERLARAYVEAIEAGDQLRLRLARAEAEGKLSKAERLERELTQADVMIDAAREALHTHTRLTADRPMTERGRPARPRRVFGSPRTAVA